MRKIMMTIAGSAVLCGTGLLASAAELAPPAQAPMQAKQAPMQAPQAKQAPMQAPSPKQAPMQAPAPSQKVAPMQAPAQAPQQKMAQAPTQSPVQKGQMQGGKPMAPAAFNGSNDQYVAMGRPMFRRSR
ncbi:MAG TPA: hypothetical protein VGI40_17790 [Pirellulaceae bacterium]|jgi:hypothetical protein